MPPHVPLRSVVPALLGALLVVTSARAQDARFVPLTPAQAQALGIQSQRVGAGGKAAATGKPVAISSMCAVFAETEIVGLLARSTPPQDIAAGVFRAIARRMCALARRIPMQGECVFTGGLATSPAFAAILSDELGLPVQVPPDPQAVGALGAALIAADLCAKKDRALTTQR